MRPRPERTPQPARPPSRRLAALTFLTLPGPRSRICRNAAVSRYLMPQCPPSYASSLHLIAKESKRFSSTARHLQIRRALLFCFSSSPLVFLSALTAGARRVFGRVQHCFPPTCQGKLFKPELLQHYVCSAGHTHTRSHSHTCTNKLVLHT